MPFFICGRRATPCQTLGSNIVLTDDNQNVLARYEYDVFGAIRSETGTSDNTRKFTGKEFDADSNLYYYGARYYDPYIGRFTQRDPIGDGVNWYAYTYNNPLKFVDPTGELAVAPYFAGSGSEPMLSVLWDPDIEHFAFNDGSGVTKWYSPEKLASLLLDFTPIIGDAKGFVEGIIGQELLTGEPLSPVDRFLGLVFLSEVRGVKKGAKLADDIIDAAFSTLDDAHNAADFIKLKKHLASEEMLGELANAEQIITSGNLRAGKRLAKEYGGEASDWVKVSTSNYKPSDGSRSFEIHAYRNNKTGQIVEPKTKFQ